LPRITPVHYHTLVKIFELDGFTVRRQKGDHIVMTKPGVKRPVVIKTSPRKVPVTHIRTNMSRLFENKVFTPVVAVSIPRAPCAI